MSGPSSDGPSNSIGLLCKPIEFDIGMIRTWYRLVDSFHSSPAPVKYCFNWSGAINLLESNRLSIGFQSTNWGPNRDCSKHRFLAIPALQNHSKPDSGFQLIFQAKNGFTGPPSCFDKKWCLGPQIAYVTSVPKLKVVSNPQKVPTCVLGGSKND